MCIRDRCIEKGQETRESLAQTIMEKTEDTISDADKQNFISRLKLLIRDYQHCDHNSPLDENVKHFQKLLGKNNLIHFTLICFN